MGEQAHRKSSRTEIPTDRCCEHGDEDDCTSVPHKYSSSKGRDVTPFARHSESRRAIDWIISSIRLPAQDNFSRFVIRHSSPRVAVLVLNRIQNTSKGLFFRRRDIRKAFIILLIPRISLSLAPNKGETPLIFP